MSTQTDPAPRTGERDPGADLKGRRTKMRNYDAEMGPVGHLAPERQRLAGLRWEHFDARPLGATVGGEISGIALADDLSDSVVAELRQALLDYKVLFFRDQVLDAGQHVAFARRFGELEVHPFIPANAQHPELVRFEKSADVGGYENGWHSDVTWRLEPSLGSILRAIAVPPSGGDTLFVDMYAVYEGLPDDLRALADDAVAIHDFAGAFGANLAPDDLAKMRAMYPAAEHPVVRTHPETHRRLVYVNRLFVTGIVGMTDDETYAFVDRLCRYTDVPEYQCRFQWQPNSVAFWDNRAVQHYASSDYWPETRIMERATVIGDRPY